MKKDINLKAIVWVNIFFILYTLVELIWVNLLNQNENRLNIFTTVGIALLLILPYAYLNSKLEFEKWYILFLIPFFPYMLYQMIIMGIWYFIFPNPYKSDDLGLGLLSVKIGFLHWFSIVIAIFLGYVIKGYRDPKLFN